MNFVAVQIPLLGIRPASRMVLLSLLPTCLLDLDRKRVVVAGYQGAQIE